MPKIAYPHSNEIIYLEANVNYTIFHLYNGQRIMSSVTLKRHAADERMQSFVRVHRAFLLNPKYIASWQKYGRKSTIKMTNGSVVQVSRRKNTTINELKNMVII